MQRAANTSLERQRSTLRRFPRISLVKPASLPEPYLEHSISIFRIIVCSGTLVLACLPFALPAVIPSTDGPQHILLARIIGQIADPTLAFERFFDLDLSTSPMIGCHLLLAALMQIFEPINALKAYLCVFVLSLWLSGSYFFSRINRKEPALLGLLPVTLAGWWPVYMGFVPHISTFPLYLLVLGCWLGGKSGMRRSAAACAGVSALWAVHLVGAVITGYALGLLAFLAYVRHRTLRRLFVDALPALLLAALLLFYLSIQRDSALAPVFYGPLKTVAAVFRYNITSLSPEVTIVNAGFLIGLSLFLGRSGELRRDLGILAASLLAICLIMPITLGVLWPAGPRVLPFIFLSSLGLLRCETSRRRGKMALLAALTVTLQAGLTLNAEIRLGRDYDAFLSGLNHVGYGSKVLPVLGDPTGGARFVHPFWSLASIYNVYRGGANPYVFAKPYWKTGESLLRYKNYPSFSHATLYTPDQTDYSGVCRSYRHIVAWQISAEAEQSFRREATIVHQQGDLKIFTCNI